MRVGTQEVGIVGGGPTGTLLSHLLHLVHSGLEKRKWKEILLCTATGLVHTGTQWTKRLP